MNGYRLSYHLDKTFYVPAEIPASATKHPEHPGDMFVWWSHEGVLYREREADEAPDGYVSDWTLDGNPLYRSLRPDEHVTK